ncbi:unnamed protein product [Schistocephalus solidus]|uniref:DUF1996 domain-containing protein n=1 Tax=Schistocephalus solidus TaxID=70667 RepID=A0A183SYB9_SCHSO|nr:unnamed protein product [Schistocephalus solidus]
MPCDDRTVSHTWDVTDAAAGRPAANFLQPPSCDGSVQNKICSQLASHFYGTRPEGRVGWVLPSRTYPASTSRPGYMRIH